MAETEQVPLARDADTEVAEAADHLEMRGDGIMVPNQDLGLGQLTVNPGGRKQLGRDPESRTTRSGRKY